MARYAFEIDREINCCFDCPLLGNDWCELAHRDNWDERDIIPEWCPLKPIEPAFCVNEVCCEEMCDEYGHTCWGAERAAT